VPTAPVRPLQDDEGRAGLAQSTRAMSKSTASPIVESRAPFARCAVTSCMLCGLPGRFRSASSDGV